MALPARCGGCGGYELARIAQRRLVVGGSELFFPFAPRIRAPGEVRQTRRSSSPGAWDEIGKKSKAKIDEINVKTSLNTVKNLQTS